MFGSKFVNKKWILTRFNKSNDIFRLTNLIHLSLLRTLFVLVYKLIIKHLVNKEITQY